MHPGIKALNQLAKSTGIQNYNELSQYCDDKTEDTSEIYFKNEFGNIIKNESNFIIEKSHENVFYCSYWGCIICYSIEKAIDMCSKYNWTAYYMNNGNPLAIN